MALRVMGHYSTLSAARKFENLLKRQKGQCGFWPVNGDVSVIRCS
jgi:hypothetical protein